MESGIFYKGKRTSVYNIHVDNFIICLKHQVARVIDINFSRPDRQRDMKDTPQQSQECNTFTELPTEEEQAAFLEGVKKICPKSTILTAAFKQPRHTPVIMPKLPKTILSLFHPKYKNLTASELVVEGKRVFENMKVDLSEADYLAHSTSLQAESLLWHEHRQGRLTASKFGAICHTRIDSPSQSLINSIFSRKVINSTSIAWGRDHESCAREEYKRQVQSQHQEFSLVTTGLHVNPLFPHLGASPDGLISCKCCGKGVLEIKCPYSI